ncbi:hypothetical protein H7R39_04740 [Campylobacter sp. Marseille-Q3452]|jgi:hypothetical protein|uniref:Uncharacterized protein n=1 Tax=Campylobacter massiliensis TaxID=2762557 RepID=A0A842J725_9BACT|nr:hypothetical protein [Campylobacter massiliensis]MBC2882570.1 hypothetical protein [Campylobacter massiliensis]
MQEQEYSELLNETKRGLKTGENLAVKAIQKTTSAISGSNFAFSKNIEEKLSEAYGNLTEQDVMLLSSKGIVWPVSILLSMFLQDFISLKQAQVQAKLNGNKIKKEMKRISEIFAETKKILEKYSKIDDDEDEKIKATHKNEWPSSIMTMIDRRFEKTNKPHVRKLIPRRINEMSDQLISDLEEAEKVITTSTRYSGDIKVSIPPLVELQDIKMEYKEIQTERDLKNHYRDILLKISEEYKLPIRVITRNELLNAICDFIKTKKLIPKQ